MEGGTLHLSMFAAPRGIFSPVLSGNGSDNQVVRLVFSGLLTLDANLMWECDLCESYTVSPDNRTISFSLRPDVKWHDGTPFTAEDVAFTFRSILHPEYVGKLSRSLAALAGVEDLLDERDRLASQANAGRITAQQLSARRAAGWKAWLEGPGRQAIEVAGPLEIRFTAKSPYAPLLANLATPIIPAHIFAKVPVSRWAKHEAVRQPVGTGPYRLAAHQPDQVRLVRHEAYHRGRPYIPQMIYHVMKQNAALEHLLTGNLDYLPVAPDAHEALEKVKKQVRVVERPGLEYHYMGLNHDSPLFSDRRVRQALMHGLHRKAMVDALLKGHGVVMNSHMLPSLWVTEGSVLNPYPYDPDKAVELLAEAGWAELDRNGWRTRQGKRFAFTLKYPAGSKVREAAAGLIQADLKKLGIQVNLEAAGFNTLVTDVFGQRGAEAWLLGWGLGVEPDPGPVFLPDNKWGRATGWRSARSEALIRQGLGRLQPAERKPVYSEWARLVNEELPFLFLYAPNEMEAVRVDRVRGLKPDARGAMWNIWEWWIPKAKQR